MPASALPLNVTPSSTPQRAPRAEAPPASPEPASTPTQTAPANGLPKAAPAPALKSGDISSPHELTAFVENLLEQLETRFDDMSSQILDRMAQMSTRVDALEASIQDIINSDTSGGMSPGLPASPSLASNGLSALPVRRTGSAA